MGKTIKGERAIAERVQVGEEGSSTVGLRFKELWLVTSAASDGESRQYLFYVLRQSVDPNKNARGQAFAVYRLVCTSRTRSPAAIRKQFRTGAILDNVNAPGLYGVDIVEVLSEEGFSRVADRLLRAIVDGTVPLEPRNEDAWSEFIEKAIVAERARHAVAAVKGNPPSGTLHLRAEFRDEWQRRQVDTKIRHGLIVLPRKAAHGRRGHEIKLWNADDIVTLHLGAQLLSLLKDNEMLRPALDVFRARDEGREHDLPSAPPSTPGSRVSVTLKEDRNELRYVADHAILVYREHTSSETLTADDYQMVVFGNDLQVLEMAATVIEQIASRGNFDVLIRTLERGSD